MKGLYTFMMARTAYVLFVVSILVFVFQLLSGLFMSPLIGQLAPEGLFVALTSALFSAGIPFVIAAIFYRVDKWLEAAE
jgi:hypothetical protein